MYIDDIAGLVRVELLRYGDAAATLRAKTFLRRGGGGWVGGPLSILAGRCNPENPCRAYAVLPHRSEYSWAYGLRRHTENLAIRNGPSSFLGYA